MRCAWLLALTETFQKPLQILIVVILFVMRFKLLQTDHPPPCQLLCAEFKCPAYHIVGLARIKVQLLTWYEGCPHLELLAFDGVVRSEFYCKLAGLFAILRDRL